MLYFSSLLKTDAEFSADAENLFAALAANGEAFRFIEHTRSIWARDYMPIRTRSGKYVSFRYEPRYLQGAPGERTDFRLEVAAQFALPLICSDINLDGGNVVFSPSRTQAIISDRVFAENPEQDPAELLQSLSALLEAEIVRIESLKDDFTGHADGMARFLSEDTILLNQTDYKNGLEQRQARALNALGFETVAFPYSPHGTKSAVGSYLNYLETRTHVFLPMFGIAADAEALRMARQLFTKVIIPVKVGAIAKDGGVFNCISWELETDEKRKDDPHE